ncbi:hypothetical protein E3U43_011053 [Larimichthys crocea]|uniref:Uncharacterized protein n=1 Tax=Larimichthys crocea TaxID=215358 RepID=A0ACD3RGK0_LARCR|nr:hypothetical protein E3U43_011053 [Larimichthys crocea]
MEKTGMFVLCVCLTFVCLGYTQETNITTATEPAATNQTTMPGHASTPITSNNHTVTIAPSPTSATSAISTVAITSSQRSTVPSDVTYISGNVTSTTQHGAGSAGTSTHTVSATTSKSGAASLFEHYSQLLVPVVCVLICGVQV